MRLKSFRTGFIAALALSIAAPAALAFGIGLQPTTVEMEVEPGDRQRQVVNIANVHKEKTISLTLGLADWTLDETGQIELTPPGETVDSSADWVRFSPAFITLKPGEAEQIVVDMATPSRLERAGDYRFALIASTVLPEERGGQSGVWKKYQIASLFYLTAGNANSAPEIIDSGINFTEDGATEIEMKIENNGNAHARLEGEIEVRGAEGEVQTIPVGNLVVLNDSKRIYKAKLTEPLPANPKIEVRLDNIFAPQMESTFETLAPYKVDPTMKKAEIAPAPEGEISIPSDFADAAAANEAQSDLN